MTGYGKAMVAGDDFSVSVDLKTVNNRFLDIHLRVGSELASLEPAIKKRITSRLSRGRVDVSVSMERSAQIAYELNRPLITGYVNALKQLQQDFGIGGELDINVIARIPGALQPAKNGIDERMTAALTEALDQALNELETMREQEGEALKRELRDTSAEDRVARTRYRSFGRRSCGCVSPAFAETYRRATQSRWTSGRDRSVATGSGSRISCRS